MWYISQKSWPCHNTAMQLSGYGVAWAHYLCISELILDIFVRICRLTPDPGSNEQIHVAILKPWEWLPLNCVCYMLLECILWHMPCIHVLFNGWWRQNTVRILSENSHLKNLWGHQVCTDINFFHDNENSRETQNTHNKTYSKKVLFTICFCSSF